MSNQLPRPGGGCHSGVIGREAACLPGKPINNYPFGSMFPSLFFPLMRYISTFLVIHEAASNHVKVTMPSGSWRMTSKLVVVTLSDKANGMQVITFSSLV